QKISGTKPAEDYELSRYASYLVAMNGDPNKPEVAASRNRFMVDHEMAWSAPMWIESDPRLIA
ncbi:phage antirepressor Ant, partial [Nocardia sp. NPDC059154]